MADNIRIALESHLLAITTPLPTEYEGVSYTPTNNVAYQSAYVMRGDTTDLSIAFDNNQKYAGIFQVTLRYPTGSGSGSAET